MSHLKGLLVALGVAITAYAIGGALAPIIQPALQKQVEQGLSKYTNAQPAPVTGITYGVTAFKP